MIIEIHRDDLEAFGVFLVIDSTYIRDFGHARPAPSRPEVDQNDLTLVLGLIQRLTLGVDEAFESKGLADAANSFLEAFDGHLNLRFDLRRLGRLELSRCDIEQAFGDIDIARVFELGGALGQGHRGPRRWDFFHQARSLLS